MFLVLVVLVGLMVFLVFLVLSVENGFVSGACLLRVWLTERGAGCYLPRSSCLTKSHPTLRFDFL